MDFSYLLNDALTLCLLIILLVSFLFLCLWYGLGWLRMGLWKDNRLPKGKDFPDKDLPSVSVVLVAHNEADALKKSLPYLLEQDYPNFEVVVVDYTSTDDTRFVLRVCSENYPNLKPVIFSRDVNMFQGKKYPLSIGIKSASKDVILLTEPNCLPSGFNWIREMMTGYAHGADIILGYSQVKPQKSLLNALERYDNVTGSARFLGRALYSVPFTGSGRNLSFGRDFFFAKGAFINQYSFPEGADDLFINRNATKKNTAVVLRNGAETIRESHPTMHSWRLERQDRMAARRHYSMAQKINLAFYPLMQMLFLASLLWLWIGGTMMWQILASVLAIRIIWELICFYFLSKYFNIKKLTYFAIFFELYFLISNTFLWLVALLRKK